MNFESIFKNVGKACGNLVEGGINIYGDALCAFYDLRGKEESSKKSRQISKDVAKTSSEIAEVCFEAVGIIADFAVLQGAQFVKAIKEYAYVKDVHVEGDLDEDKIVEPINFEVIN